MLAPTKKIAKFLEELRMPSLLVQPFPAQMQIFSIVRTAVLYIRNADTAARTFNCRALKEERMRKSRE